MSRIFTDNILIHFVYVTISDGAVSLTSVVTEACLTLKGGASAITTSYLSYLGVSLNGFGLSITKHFKMPM